MQKGVRREKVFYSVFFKKTVAYYQLGFEHGTRTTPADTYVA